MDNKEYLKWCKVYRGEDKFPYPRNNKEDEYKYIYWRNERSAVRDCMDDNIQDSIKIIEVINSYIRNGLSMYHDDWAIGVSISSRTLKKIQEYESMPFLGS